MMSAAERTAFRDGWAEELAKRGTFDRFEQVVPSTALHAAQVPSAAMPVADDGRAVACMKP